MKRVTLKHSTLTLAIALGVAAPAAFAQDAEAPDAGSNRSATTLDAVTVTARKREETLQEVPVAVTAFTADALDKLNVEDLADLDAQVPNLTVYAARGSNSTITAYIRGVGQSDPLWGFDPGVGIYLDDVYIARPQGGLLDVFDVERIEVLRGPQGTLYGKNTIGGAIKYISRGLPKKVEGFGSITVGNYDQLDAKAAIGGAIGGEDSGLRGRVAVASLNRDGFGRNLLTGQEVSDKEINAVRLSLGAYAGDDFDVQFAFDWTDDQSGVRGSKMLAPNPLAPTSPPLESRYDIRSAMRNVNDTEVKGISATVNWRPSEDWSIKYVVAKRESDTDTNIDFDTTPLKLVDVRADYADQQVSHELQVNYDAGGASRGVIGLYAFDGEASGRIQNHFYNPLLPIALTNPLYGQTGGSVYTESMALYADWTFDLGERFGLNVGARYTDEDKRGVVLNQFMLTPFATPWFTAANFDKTTNFKNVSPKVSLDYQITPDVMVYGLASRGFKSGGYNIRANVASSPQSGDPFQDEQVDSYEVGAKFGLLEQTLFVNLAAFHNVYKDMQLSVFTSCSLGGVNTFCADFTNAGKATINGFEAEYQWLPSEHWAITGNLAWLDAKFDEYLFKGVNIANQQAITNAPEFSGAINLEWRTALSGGGNLSARVGYSYQSSVVATTEVVRDPVLNVALPPPITEDGYGLVGAGIIWKPNATWTLSLQGSNLTDEAYRTTGYNIAAYGALTGFYGPPRQYSLTARYDF